MDKLSEHAIRMLEIEGKGKNDGYIETRNMGDIARAVYDLILQVQMLKMADRKTENCSEKPNNCDTCKYGEDKHRYAHICNECGVGINNYEPKENHSGEVTEMVEPQSNILLDAMAKAFGVETEPQTEVTTDCRLTESEGE